jgi:hypothetical protein
MYCVPEYVVMGISSFSRPDIQLVFYNAPWCSAVLFASTRHDGLLRLPHCKDIKTEFKYIPNEQNVEGRQSTEVTSSCLCSHTSQCVYDCEIRRIVISTALCIHPATETRRKNKDRKTRRKERKNKLTNKQRRKRGNIKKEDRRIVINL